MNRPDSSVCSKN